jgi:hypothetical protein
LKATNGVNCRELAGHIPFNLLETPDSLFQKVFVRDVSCVAFSVLKAASFVNVMPSLEVSRWQYSEQNIGRPRESVIA